MGEGKRERRGQNKYLSNSDWDFSKINDRYRSTDPGSSQNIQQDKQQKPTSRQIIPNYIQTAEKQRQRKNLKEAREAYSCGGIKIRIIMKFTSETMLTITEWHN